MWDDSHIPQRKWPLRSGVEVAILPALDTGPCVHGNMQPLSAIQGFQLWEVGKSLVTYLIRPVRKSMPAQC